ncbi:hypothetical protein F5Y13DRAFT_31988 [Hypoxylon sp. FL1857]|nr:hypothetical protein F5Y13DRAFT_31988 [Hypoxylon sp. FL1857]
MPPDIGAWRTKYRQSRDVRKVGLRTLADILQEKAPIDFNEVLCAIIVLHAILDFTSKRNSFEGDVESTLSRWSYMNSLTGTNRESVGLVLKRLASSPACLRDLPGSGVLGTGSMFAEDTFRPLSIVVNDSSLSDIPTYGPSGYNTGAPLTSQFNNVYISQSGYPIPPSFNQPQTSNSYPSWGPGNPALSHSAMMNMEYSFQNNLGPYSQQHGAGQLYGSTQSSGYIQHERPPDMVDPDRHTPLVLFMVFLDGFIGLGDLYRLFCGSIDSIHPMSLPTTYNSQVSACEFLMDAERTLFSPLSNWQSLQEPLIQAIISTTRSFALLGGLSSLSSMVRYMIYLGMVSSNNLGLFLHTDCHQNILENRESCCDFSLAVLKHCPPSSVADVVDQFSSGWGLTQNQSLEQFVEEIGRHHSGAYHPAHLVQSPDIHPRNHRPLQTRESTAPSRGSSSRHTPSIVDFSISNQQSRMDTTEMSVVSELTTNTTPSTTSTVKCKECGKLFKGKNLSSHLSRHKRSHRDADEIQCPCGCPKIFRGSRTDNIRAHCRKVHNEELPPDYWAARTFPPES